jgi:hypothetical protein
VGRGRDGAVVSDDDVGVEDFVTERGGGFVLDALEEHLCGAAVGLAGFALVVRHEETARVQEGQQILLHALMDAVEAGLGL